MKSDTVRTWAWHIALAVSVLISLLSLKAGISFLFSILRAILSFCLIYGISAMALVTFNKTGSPMKEESLGTLLDITVGQDDHSAAKKPIAGQVNLELTKGLPDAEQQAEIIRRMGWGGD